MSAERPPAADADPSAKRPPRLAEAILAISLPVAERDEILGDMAESLARRVKLDGVLRANLWYFRQALTIPARLIARRVTMSMNGAELRHTLRGLAHSPGFAAVAILSLGLGIGANTALFSVVRSVLYTPLPVESPEELRLVYYQIPEIIDDNFNQYSSSQALHPSTEVTLQSNYSYPLFRRLRDAAGPDVQIMGFNFARRLALIVDDQPAVAATGLVADGHYFSTLKLPLVAGRPLDEGDDRADAPRVAVISASFWQRVLGGDLEVIGKVIRLNGEPFEIVGVTAPEFVGLSPGGFFSRTDITVPFSSQPVVAPGWSPDSGSLQASENRFWVRMIARLPAGADAAPLEEAMTVAMRESLISTGIIDPETVGDAKVFFIDGSRGLDSVGRDMRRPLAIVAGVVALVLLIACVNLASMMLARGAARSHELSVRRALGAGRWRIMRQLLLESFLLSMAGGALGLVIALWGGPAIATALSAGIGGAPTTFSLETELLLIVSAVSIVAALAFGLLPAVRLTRPDAFDQLRARGLSGDGPSRFTLGRSLIAVQIAVSIPLLVGAGLFLQTLGNLGSVELGFDASDLVIFSIEPRMVADEPGRITAIYRDVLEGVDALPGVESATLVENALLIGRTSNGRVEVDGELVPMYMNAIGPRYFETMRIPLLSGRAFTLADSAAGPRVVLVNETAQREVFDGNALGRIFIRGNTQFEVVGVVADSKYDSMQREITPTYYDPHTQRSLRSAFVLLRTRSSVGELQDPIKDVVSRAAPGLPVTGLRSQTDLIAGAVARERVFARMLAVFGGFALLIACIGLYGVTSFAVARRRAEVGVRLALGARPPQILWMVLRQVLALSTVGLAVGLFVAYWVGPVVDSMLYGLEPTDLATFVGAGLVMLLVALVAGWFPALRAAKTDALIALSRD